MTEKRANPVHANATGFGKVGCLLAINNLQSDISLSEKQGCDSNFCPIKFIARRHRVSEAYAGLLCELMQIGGGE